MNWIEGLILGIVQGVTEFLPISSSGHLIAVRELTGIQAAQPLMFDVMVHVATLAAILIYFYRDIWRLIRAAACWVWRRPVSARDRSLLGAIIIGTIPAGLIGVFFADVIETAFRRPEVVVFALLGGSLVFLCADRWSRGNRDVSIHNGFLVGLFQVLAFIPGTSRAGITIAGGLLGGLTRADAIRLSFLLGIPIIAGAGLQTLGNVVVLSHVSTAAIVGSISAFLVGLAAIHFLVRYLTTHTFTAFVIYRIVVAILLFIFIV